MKLVRYGPQGREKPGLIDAAGTLHLYAVYQHLDADVDLIDSKLANVSAPLDNFQLFYTGARLDF